MFTMKLMDKENPSSFYMVFHLIIDQWWVVWSQYSDIVKDGDASIQIYLDMVKH